MVHALQMAVLHRIQELTEHALDLLVRTVATTQEHSVADSLVECAARAELKNDEHQVLSGVNNGSMDVYDVRVLGDHMVEIHLFVLECGHGRTSGELGHALDCVALAMAIFVGFEHRCLVYDTEAALTEKASEEYPSQGSLDDPTFHGRKSCLFCGVHVETGGGWFQVMVYAGGRDIGDCSELVEMRGASFCMALLRE